jgi:hypothetical protein
MELSVAQRQRLKKVITEVTEIVGGCLHADGTPITFDQLENECVEVGDWMTSAVLEQRVTQRNAQQLASCCPTCGCQGEPLAEDEARVLQTDRGDVAWMEPNYYCRRCRRSFFPSLR